ncbi:MAG: helix-turn-helix domain-containing protein [Sphingomonadaceae bacterium]
MLDFNIASAPEICNELGQRLRARRLQLGWSQDELGRRAGLSGGSVKNLESKAQSSLDSFVRIVCALGLAEQLASLCALKVDSIAAMESAALAPRQRAPRQGKR